MVPVKPEDVVVEYGSGGRVYLGRTRSRLNSARSLVGIDRTPRISSSLVKTRKAREERCRVHFLQSRVGDLRPLGQSFDFNLVCPMLYSFPNRSMRSDDGIGIENREESSPCWR